MKKLLLKLPFLVIVVPLNILQFGYQAQQEFIPGE
jgi:hypothetical protein